MPVRTNILRLGTHVVFKRSKTENLSTIIPAAGLGTRRKDFERQNPIVLFHSSFTLPL